MRERNHMTLPMELKDLRLRFRKSLAQCAAVIGAKSAETYRLKEAGRSPVSGLELALLADAYGMPLRAAFPSYRPSAGEVALARHLNRAA